MAPRFRLLPILAIVTATAPMAAFVTRAEAQTGAAADRDSVRYVLPEQRVQTARKPVSERESATIVRRDREELSRFQPASTGDALATAPGVELVKTGAWATRLALRGLSGERVLLTVDGVRLNTGRGHGSQASLIALEDLEEVEVSPGSGGVFAGSDALGGVVNLVTRRTMFAPSLAASGVVVARGAAPGGTVASSGRVRVQAPALGFEASGGLGEQDALVPPAGALDHSGSRDEHWALRASARREGLRADLERTRYDGRDIGLPAFGSDPDARGAYPLQSRRADRFDLAWRDRVRPWTGTLRLHTQSFRTTFEEVGTDTIISSRTRQPIATRTSASVDELVTDARGVRAEFGVGAGGPHGATLVFEGRDEETRGPGVRTVETRTMDGTTTGVEGASTVHVPPATRGGYAFVANGATRFRGTRFEAGLRFDRLVSQAGALEDSSTGKSTPAIDVTDRRVSGELGAARPIGAFTPYARLATGFRSPNLEERFFDGLVHGGLRIFGNALLRAETSRTAELGLRFERAGTRRARISAYRSDCEEFIELAYLGQLYLVPRFQYVNVQRARIEGVELEWTGPVPGVPGVQVAFSAASPRGVDRETGERLLGTGPRRVGLDARAALATLFPGSPDVTFAARARWSDAIRTGSGSSAGTEDGRVVLSRPAFWNCALELSARRGGTDVAFTVRNLFDHAYREPLSFIEEPGRTFGLTLRRAFALGGETSTSGSITP